MSRFYSNDKVLGCYFIVTYLLSVSSSAMERSWIKGEFRDNGEINYNYGNTESCLKNVYRKGTHVGVIALRQNENTTFSKKLPLTDTNSSYKDLIEKITFDCNGRAQCNSSHSELLINKTSFQQDIPFDYLYILLSCKPITVDNDKVFDIGLDYTFVKINTTRRVYMILRLRENKNIHRQCEIDGNQSHFRFTVLHVDFGQYWNCRQGSSNNRGKCLGNITSFSSEQQNCSHTWLPSVTFKMIECYTKTVNIDIDMSAGIVWIEIEANNDLRLNCSESKIGKEVTSHMTTLAPHNNTSGYLYNIVIPVSVAFLVLVIIISSFVFCMCHRNSSFRVWKQGRRESALRNRQNGAYNNDPTYNTIISPGTQSATKGVSPGHTTDDDYADISHVDKFKNSQPKVTSVAHKKSNKPMKTPALSKPSFKVEKRGEEAPDDELGVTYATVNKVKKVENTESRGAITADAVVPTLTEAGGEYSHLAQFKKKNYENVYNC